MNTSHSSPHKKRPSRGSYLGMVIVGGCMLIFVIITWKNTRATYDRRMTQIEWRKSWMDSLRKVQSLKDDSIIRSWEVKETKAGDSSVKLKNK